MRPAEIFPTSRLSQNRRLTLSYTVTHTVLYIVFKHCLFILSLYIVFFIHCLYTFSLYIVLIHYIYTLSHTHSCTLSLNIVFLYYLYTLSSLYIVFIHFPYILSLYIYTFIHCHTHCLVQLYIVLYIVTGCFILLRTEYSCYIIHNLKFSLFLQGPDSMHCSRNTLTSASLTKGNPRILLS